MSETAPANPHRYQRWADRPARRRWAWPAIMTTGVRLANKNTRTRGLIWTSLGFAVGSCGLFYALAQLEILAGTPQAEGLYEFVRMILGVDLGGVSRLAEYREVLWRAAFLFMFKAELFWAFVVIAFAGPSLIADDLKTNALPIYFARPVTPLTYLFGKWLVLAVYTSLAVLVSNVLGLFFGVLVTGGLATFGQTARLASDLLCCGLGATLFAGILMLTLSSMCRDKRYVTVGWVAIFVLPMVVQGILNDTLPRGATAGWLGSVSLYGDLASLAEWKLGLRQALEATGLPHEAFHRALGRAVDPAYPAFILSAVTVAAAWFCHRQVLRFSRSAANV
jgi:ABC-type transport system involved in multi-copper enzyme maturation permease subunit